MIIPRLRGTSNVAPPADLQSSSSDRSTLIKFIEMELQKTLETEEDVSKRNDCIIMALMDCYTRETLKYDYQSERFTNFVLEVFTELAKPLNRDLLNQIKKSDPLQVFLILLPVPLKDFKSMINIDGEYRFQVFKSSKDFKILVITRGYQSRSPSVGYQNVATTGVVLDDHMKVLVNGHSHPVNRSGSFSAGDSIELLGANENDPEEFVVCLVHNQLDLSIAETYNGQFFSTLCQEDIKSVPVLQRYGILS